MTTAEAVRDWWLIRLQAPASSAIGDDTSAARALRARLRRADSALEVLSEAAVHELVGGCPGYENGLTNSRSCQVLAASIRTARSA